MEVTRWQAFAELEPFGPRVDLWRMGMIASTIANGNRRKRTSRVFKPTDFFPPDPTPASLAPKTEAYMKMKMDMVGAIGRLAAKKRRENRVGSRRSRKEAS